MIETVTALDILPESTLRSAVDVMVRLVEACGAVVIVVGAVIAIVKFAVTLARRDIGEFSSVRLTLGRFLALGLEFQLASDVLRTAISPSFEEIGKLAAIAAIRTAFNYFLAREIAEEQRAVEEARAARSAPDASPR
ncbi:DUF1622 domain-containing protein [Mycolicibacterium monacense]|uniref:DUF1622 domain-containing protein n=2 Tax=Mycobacteriaceae TaxID=1762 RepID=A0AAD1IV99_MYCMB|nr:DUF1622 domain-containing protein [Mycolicibacterium monacense]MDA4104930.1 membrane protein [Mycolicibacterium monacense DSM 44395]ORB23892.1 hypothetical protein BST34_02480 [Mycolicibacterium monacense DSM 44395]QHP85847.1 DUF1622 domain-containing protein [Mycolicibacterium monacense DSM 44395]BBZ61229.1 hypothetical protein MMON_25300 [Mycolicibacterium monacense]